MGEIGVQRLKDDLVVRTRNFLKTEEVKRIASKYCLLLGNFMSKEGEPGALVCFGDNFHAQLRFEWAVEASKYIVYLELKLLGYSETEEEFSIVNDPDGDAWQKEVVLQALKDALGGRLVNRVYCASEKENEKDIYPSLEVEETEVGKVLITFRDPIIVC